MDGLRVLVAEDHERLRLAMVAILILEFEVVDAVGDGEELVRAAILHQPDVIVSDITMPLLDGFSARAELLRKGIEIPFVFVTLMKLASLRAAGQEGAVGYVHKTDLSEELTAGVRAVVVGDSYVSRSFRVS